MMEATVIQRIASLDFHKEVRPEYFHRLKKIEKGKFLNEKEFEKEMLK